MAGRFEATPPSEDNRKNFADGSNWDKAKSYSTFFRDFIDATSSTVNDGVKNVFANRGAAAKDAATLNIATLGRIYAMDQAGARYES